MGLREELAKLAWAEGQRFDCASWVHKARSMPKEEFTREVEKGLKGRETGHTKSSISRLTGQQPQKRPISAASLHTRIT